MNNKKIIVVLIAITIMSIPSAYGFWWDNSKSKTLTLIYDTPEGFEKEKGENSIWFEKIGDKVLHYDLLDKEKRDDKIKIEMDEDIYKTIEYNNTTTFYKGEAECYTLHQINEDYFLFLKCEHIRPVGWNLNENEFKEDVNIFKNFINSVKLEYR